MRRTTAEDLRGLWSGLGILPGCVVLCHSFLPSLGLVEDGPGVIVDTLLEALGPQGTLVVPAFTYSYMRREIFNVAESPSTVGALGDLTRARQGAVRSLDPCFSNIALGSRAKELMDRPSKRAIGPDSIYDRLLASDLQCLLLGVGWTALPVFMHLEAIHQVSYRYYKEFHGVTRQGDREFEDVCVHFVRDLDLNPQSDRNRVGALIDQKPDCAQVQLAYGRHRLVPATTVATVVKEQLAVEPFCLIKEPVGA